MPDACRFRLTASLSRTRARVRRKCRSRLEYGPHKLTEGTWLGLSWLPATSPTIASGFFGDLLVKREVAIDADDDDRQRVFLLD